ncbi:MAG: hypothetical protein WC867_08480 [Candidatus Pacearchaeota archaeon]|jgi:hypothetical protein
MKEKFDVFEIDPRVANELLYNYYFSTHNDYKERWYRAKTSGVPVEVINHFARTREIETRYLPLLYKDLFGEISPDEADDKLLELLGKSGARRNG